MKRAAKLVFLVCLVLIGAGTISRVSGENVDPSHAAPKNSPTPVTSPPGVIESSSSVPLRDSPQLLQETIVKESQSTNAQNNSVESFFQIGPDKRNSAEGLLMQPALATFSTSNKSKSLPHGVYRCIWHILDNAGIPMFFGQDTSYIDPSLKETYLISSPMLPRERAVTTEMEKTTTQASQAPAQPATMNSPTVLQKIPVSELEGVPLPAPRDENVQQP